MDLIYTDNQLNDLGVLSNYTIDFAFGSEENDFEIKVPITNNVLEIGMYIYYPGTGYGGVIDEKKVSRIYNTITLSGRTLEGILEGAVICPTNNMSYYVVEGDANVVISDLLEHCNLSALFCGASDEIGEIQAFNCRYDQLYSTLMTMLKSANLTLQITTTSGSNNKTMFKLSAKKITDYSQDEEWTSDEIKVESGVIGNQVNHLICLGPGNMTDRKIIHLFSDISGNIMPYKTVDMPTSDSDYILDESQKVSYGLSEITAVYDYSSAARIENFIIQTEQPSDWEKQELFYKKVDGEYTQVEYIQETQFSQLTNQPTNWSSGFSNYYEVAEGVYTTVSEQKNYTVLSSQPSDWAVNYNNYYYQYSDGVTRTYPKVKGTSVTTLVVQTEQPSDWETNYTSYKRADGSTIEPGIEYRYEVLLLYYERDGGRIYDYANMRYGELYKNYDPDGLGANCYDIATNGYYDAYKMGLLANDYPDIQVIHNKKVVYARDLPGMLAPLNTALQEMWDAEVAWLIVDTEWAWDDFIQKRDAFTELYMACTLKDAFYFAHNTINEKWEIIMLPQEIIFKELKTREVPPPWYPYNYATEYTSEVAPTWQSNYYYNMTTSTPEYKPGKYYRAEIVKKPNEFVKGKFYRKVIDNYYNLVAGGVKRMADLRKPNTITAKLDARRDYELGDMVAVRETITNTTATMTVSKKILTGTNGKLSISYTLE